MKETITKNDIGVLADTFVDGVEKATLHKKEEANKERQRQLNDLKMKELDEFKKLIQFDQVPKCDQDMIKCSTCKRSMGIKKWARLATKKLLTCPGCGATAEAGTKVKVVFKEPSRFKIESVKTGKASVETRADGSRLIKEEVVVRVKPITKKD